MKLLKAFFIVSFLLFGSVSLFANGPKVKNINYGFEQDRMTLDQGQIFIVSGFDSEDHLTVYNLQGTLLWDIKFHAKVLSWKIAGDDVIVFSVDREGKKTFLTSIDRLTGSISWQRP